MQSRNHEESAFHHSNSFHKYSGQPGFLGVKEFVKTDQSRRIPLANRVLFLIAIVIQIQFPISYKTIDHVKHIAAPLVQATHSVSIVTLPRFLLFDSKVSKKKSPQLLASNFLRQEVQLS